MINYCLLVDKLVEQNRFPVEAVEHALLLHSVNEEKSRQHLQVLEWIFCPQLFPPKFDL
jgi:hypothetical protein